MWVYKALHCNDPHPALSVLKIMLTTGRARARMPVYVDLYKKQKASSGQEEAPDLNGSVSSYCLFSSSVMPPGLLASFSARNFLVSRFLSTHSSAVFSSAAYAAGSPH